MRSFIFGCMVLLALGMISCKNDKILEAETLIKEWDGKEVLFPKEIHFSIYGKDEISNVITQGNYKILSYVDSAGCTSCKLHLKQWKDLIMYFDTMHLNVPILFFIHSADIKELKSILRRNKFDYPVCIDVDDSLNTLNHFPSNNAFQTFLLDKNNKVVAIGNPVHNPKVKELYMNIIQGMMDVKEGKRILTKIKIRQHTISLGRFDWKEEQKVQFSISNVGDQPLVINDISTSCGCIHVDYPKQPVRPNDSISLKVTYKADHPEHFDKTITVYCNANPSLIHLKVMGDAE